MGHKTKETNNVVRIVVLRLNKTQQEQCETLRREAGCCWSDMIQAHVASRSGRWLTGNELMAMFKGQYALHSQTIQALAQKLDANIQTARELRQQEAQMGDIKAKYPYRTKRYQTVPWKSQAIRRANGNIILSNGQGRRPLVLKLPAEYQDADIRKAELTWRADHYELCITIDTGETNPPLSRRVKTAGVDQGEINIATVVTDEGKGIVVSGRHLRSVKRLRNKRHAAYQERMDRCKPGSRRHQRLKKRKAQATAKFTRQQRDMLHKASLQTVNFCEHEQVAHIAIGDVRGIQDGVNLGRKSNQKIAQWPHGQFVQYTQYRARRRGMTTGRIPEDYSTKTCSVDGYVIKSAPRGRVFRCPGCGSVVHRDGNGAANICSRARYGEYGQVQVDHLTYLRPVQLDVVEPLTRANVASPKSLTAVKD